MLQSLVILVSTYLIKVSVGHDYGPIHSNSRQTSILSPTRHGRSPRHLGLLPKPFHFIVSKRDIIPVQGLS